MNTTGIGQAAETVATEYLERKGYRVVERNWKTRWCEIDIVASHDDRIYFVEVKFRRQSMQGSGLEYITPRKLEQMHLAAELWVSMHAWHGDYSLAAIEISGDNQLVSAFVSDLL